MPFSTRCYIYGLVAVAVSVIATLPLSGTRPLQLLELCALVITAERLSRVQIGASGWTMSVSLVVTLIAVLVVPPPAAAVVGLVTSLPIARRPSRAWTWTKQILNSAMTSLVPASGAAVCHLAGGHAPGHFLNFPEFLWPSAAAVTTCLVANALIIAGYVRFASHTRFTDALRGDLRRATMPYYSSGVLALIFLSLWNDIGWFTAPLVVVPMYFAHWSLSQYSKENAAHEGTIAALVQAVEIKDSYTRGHSERVARGAEMIAQRLKMPQDRLAMLRFAGLLHDIGKLGVPTRLLTSTGGLTEEEFKLMCMHPNHGVAVLRDIRFLTEVYEGVLYHHERLDGRGYPTGKSGAEIPEFARIIGVADAFDAMTSTRSYRAARSVEEAVAELRRGAGSQFDPVLVQAFEEALEIAELAGRPWVPTELAPPEPQPDDETATAASGPWPLPKRVPGFSFADHDDPFVPVEWFSAWYPSWLAPGAAAEGAEVQDEPDAQDAQDAQGAGARPGAERLGAIPGQRAGEQEPVPVPELADPGTGEVVSGDLGGTNFGDVHLDDVHLDDVHLGDMDLDDGWSERMHSAVVREPGPEPDEGWAWDGERVEAAEEPADPSETAKAGSAPENDSEPRAVADVEPARSADPEHTGDLRGSMRVRALTSAADPDPRGPGVGAVSSADIDLRAPATVGRQTPVRAPEPAGDGDGRDDDTVSMPQPKPGDPEAWTPSTEPWPAPETPADTPKVADPAEPAEPSDADRRATPVSGSSWFARGSAGSPASATRHFGPGDPGPWPPRDPDEKDDQKDSEESPA